MTQRYEDVCTLNSLIPTGAPFAVERLIEPGTQSGQFVVRDTATDRPIMPPTRFYAVVWAFIEGYRKGRTETPR